MLKYYIFRLWVDFLQNTVHIHELKFSLLVSLIKSLVKICWFNLWRWQPVFWPADFWIKDNWLPIPWASHCLEFRYILKRVVFLSFTPLQTVHPHPKPTQSIDPQSFQFLESDFEYSDMCLEKLAANMIMYIIIYAVIYVFMCYSSIQCRTAPLLWLVCYKLRSSNQQIDCNFIFKLGSRNKLHF